MKTSREVLSWCMFDFAETGFSALFVTFFFPVLILEVLNGTQTQIGLVMGISTAIAGLIVPFIGALSDASGRRMPYLIIFTIITSTLTFFVAFANLWAALILAVIINIFYRSSLDIYDSLLGEVENKKIIGRISGWGTAIGYMGSIGALVMARIVLYYFGDNIRIMFPAIAIFYLFFASIMFFFLKDKKTQKIDKKAVIKEAASNLLDTIKSLPKTKPLLFFLLASFLFMDGANTAITFMYAYGHTVIGITKEQFIPIFLLASLWSGIGALLFGKITDKIGPRKTLITSICLWIFIVFFLRTFSTLIGFIIGASIGGMALAALWTATRPMMLRLAPKEKLAQLFGFQGLTEKFGAFLAPPLFGYLSTHFGGKSGMVMLAAFFVLALMFMLKTPDTPI